MAHPRASTLADIVKALLHHLDTKYLRARLNGPRQALIIILSVIHSGADRMGLGPARIAALARLDVALTWSHNAVPSISAIARALRKLKPSQLEAVIAAGLSAVTQAYGPHLLQHGYRLVAIDGVRMNTQRTTVLARLFGLPKYERTKKAHQPQALVVVARCVRTGVVLAQEIVRHTGSERVCAQKMIAHLSQMGPILVVLDRGFPSRELIGCLQQAGIKYIARMCSGISAWKEIQPHITDAKAKDLGLDVRLKKSDRSTAKAALRVVIAAKGKTGRPRCNRKQQRCILLTNLKGCYWSAQRLLAIYYRRWDIETSLREDKRLLGSVRSRAKTKDGFINELHALHIYRIIMALIAAMVVSEIGMPPWEDDRAKRIITTQLIATAWIVIEMALIAPERCTDKIAVIIREIARDAPKRRPGRSEKRVCKGREGAWKRKVEKDHY